MFTDHSVSGFLDELASADPVPGGGSACALAGAIAAGLVSMVCNLTVGKRRYKEVEASLQDTLAQSEIHRSRLMQLLEEDTEVYNRVMLAYRMPTGTEEERSARDEAWQAALLDAADVPMAIARECLGVVLLAETAGRLGNPWAVSDAGAAALLAEGAARAAGLSVEVNLRSIHDEAVVSGYRDDLASLEQEAHSICQRALIAVQARMGA